MPVAVRARSGIPIKGLKKTHARPIVRHEIVAPTMSENRNAAKEATEPISAPTRGKNASTVIIGEKRRYKPNIVRIIPSGRKNFAFSSFWSYCSKYWS